jgi:digeranylgeranylglycerophospholipid reductase
MLFSRRMQMGEYDVIIVGAGPAGLAAAKAAAQKKAKTIVLEEHRRIGIPSHCTGRLHSTERPDILAEIVGSMDKRVVIRGPGPHFQQRIFAPDGRLLWSDKSSSLHYLVDRAVFDQELAKQAISAGAEIVLGARVAGLIKRDGRVVGVATASGARPEVFGKVVIAADGLAGGVRGVAKWEGLAPQDQTYVSGITMELAGIKDGDSVGGSYTGSYLVKGWFSITPSGPESCVVQFMTLEEYKGVMEGDYLLSRVLRNAFPIRMDAWKQTSDLGVRFSEIVRDGLILTGSAANWRGTVISMVSGRYAGEVAAEAVQEGDTSGERLGRFIGLYEKTGLTKELYQHSSWWGSRPFGGSSDEEIEKRITAMIEKTGLSYIPSAPVLGLRGRSQ